MAELPIMAAWRATATSNPRATKLTYDEVWAIAKLMKAGRGDKELSASYRIARQRCRKIRRILGDLVPKRAHRYTPGHRAELEAAAREWAASGDSQAVVATRRGVPRSAISRVAIELGLTKVEISPEEVDRRARARLELLARQRELDRLWDQRRQEIIAELDRRRNAAGGIPWDHLWRQPRRERRARA